MSMKLSNISGVVNINGIMDTNIKSITQDVQGNEL